MSNPKESKMGKAPIHKLMLSMGIPMILSMMLQAFYNIVDSAFVSNIKDSGEVALNALTLAFPVQMLMIAIGIGTGVGANALLSKSLGQGDREKAGKTAGNAIFLATVIYFVFLLFGILGTKVYISSQTKNPQIMEMATSYLRICCIFSMGIVYFSVFEKILQATGKSVYSTIAQVTGALVNIILDPIMIYGLFGCPEMGVNGAAYATVIGQIASFLCAMIFHLKVNKEVKNGLKYMKPDGIKYGMMYTLIIMLVGFVALELFADSLAAVFGLSGETAGLCVSAIRIISVSYLFAGANIVYQGIFQALDSGLESLIISICRQFLFVVPVAFGLAWLVKTEGFPVWTLWITFLISEGVSVAISIVFMKRVEKRRIKEME